MGLTKASLRLLLIRHGDAVGNAEGVMIGQFDVPLTSLGCEQVRRTGEALAKESIQCVYASPLRRAANTAAEIAVRTGAPVETVDDLREMNVGAAHGLTWPEIAERWPEFARGYTDADRGITVPWPEGECGRDLCGRITRTIDKIVYRHIREPRDESANEACTVAVVAHGGSLAWVFHHLLKKPLNSWPRYGIPNASISEFLVHTPDEPAALLRINDVSHLENLARDLSAYRGRF